MEKDQKLFSSDLKGRNIIIGVMALIIVLMLLGGGYGYKALNKRIKKEIDLKEKQITDSKKKQDSLLNLVDHWKSDADYSRQQTEILSNKNRELYEKLKIKEKQLGVRDTTFGNNARIITNSVNRYYWPKDNIR